MLEIGTQKPQGKTFAINVAQKNAKGEVTRYKYFETDSADELHDFWQKNSTTPRKREGKKQNNTA